MNRIYIFLIFNLIASISIAQTDSISRPDSIPRPAIDSTPLRIANCRQALLASFLREDPAQVGLWIDSLTRLENLEYVGLVWDERWLLYYWTASYGTLLEEVSHFDENQRLIQSIKIQPTPDSLFEWVDFTLYEKRFDVFSSIGRAFLNSEEKAVTTLLFEYLLRLNNDKEDWADRLQAFEDKYPKSPYREFINQIKPTIVRPSQKALGLSCGLLAGTWQGVIERTFSTPYAFNFDLYYCYKRWNFLFDGTIGGPTITRDLLEKGDYWPTGDPTTFFTLGLNLGYDIVNTPKLRVFPSIGGGFGSLHPPTPGEEDDPLPDYYDKFTFKEFHLAAALTTDIKMFPRNQDNWNNPKGSYHGIRLKFGWNGLNFGKQNEALQGGMIYFAVNYNLFAFIPK